MSTRILLINPNTTATMTEGMAIAARAAARPGTEIEISTWTGAGIDDLTERLQQFAAEATGHGEPALLDREFGRAAVAEDGPRSLHA